MFAAIALLRLPGLVCEAQLRSGEPGRAAMSTALSEA